VSSPTRKRCTGVDCRLSSFKFRSLAGSGEYSLSCQMPGSLWTAIQLRKLYLDLDTLTQLGACPRFQALCSKLRRQKQQTSSVIEYVTCGSDESSPPLVPVSHLTGTKRYRN